MEQRPADGPAGLRRRRVRQDRGGASGPSSRPSRTASRWRCWCRPRCWPASTSRPSPTASPASRSGSRCSAAFLTPAQARQVVDGLADGSVDVVIGTHRLLAGDVALQGPRAARRRRGAALRGDPQRGDQAARPRASTCSPSPPARSPGPSRWASPASATSRCSTPRRPTASRSSPTSASTTSRPSSEAIRRELLREGQVFFVHNRVADIEAVAGAICGPGARGPGRGRPRPDGRGHPRAGRARLLGAAATTSWCARPSSSRASTCRRSTPWSSTGPTCLGLGQLHQLRGRVGRAGQRAYAYLFHPADRVLTEQAYERLRTIGEHTELGSGFKIAMRDLEIRGAGQPPRRRPVRPHRRGRLRPVRPDGGRGGGRGPRASRCARAAESLARRAR